MIMTMMIRFQWWQMQQWWWWKCYQIHSSTFKNINIKVSINCHWLIFSQISAKNLRTWGGGRPPEPSVHGPAPLPSRPSRPWLLRKGRHKRKLNFLSLSLFSSTSPSVFICSNISQCQSSIYLKTAHICAQWLRNNKMTRVDYPTATRWAVWDTKPKSGHSTNSPTHS